MTEYTGASNTQPIQESELTDKPGEETVKYNSLRDEFLNAGFNEVLCLSSRQSNSPRTLSAIGHYVAILDNPACNFDSELYQLALEKAIDFLSLRKTEAALSLKRVLEVLLLKK